MPRGAYSNPEERSLKIAATKCGCTLEEYSSHLALNQQWCPKCKLWKSIELFALCKRAKRGRYCYCNSCHAEMRKADVENLSLKKKLWREGNQDKVKAYGDSPQCKFSSYKSRAKRRHYRWDLTFEEFLTFWQKPCAYCGTEISTVGIDRIQNELGYSPSNCIACCVICNRMKKEYSVEFWLAHMVKVLKFWKAK